MPAQGAGIMVNDSFVQFRFQIDKLEPYDAKLVEENIFLLSDNVALELDATDGEHNFNITDMFLELS